MNHPIEFCGCKCDVVKSTYLNGQPVLHLIALQNEHNQSLDFYPGETIGTATICVPSADLSDNQTVIKDYSENEGVLKALVDANVVKPTGRQIQTGFVRSPVVELV